MTQQRSSSGTNRLAAGLGLFGVGLGLAVCARQLGRVSGAADGRRAARVRVIETITVNQPIDIVYGFWRRFENFPRFMRYVESIECSGSKSHWRVRGPAGVRVEWDAELVEDRPNERLSWRTTAEADVDHQGVVRFAHAPGSRGTEVSVDLSYRPPAGRVGRSVAWLFGSDPEAQVREDLRRFKQIVEAGEVTLSDGPALWRPAQPHKRPQRLKKLAGVRS